LAVGIVFYFLIYLLERASGGKIDQYRSRGFVQDVAYWFYYQSGLNQFLFMATLFSFLGPRLAFLRQIVGIGPLAECFRFSGVLDLALDFLVWLASQSKCQRGLTASNTAGTGKEAHR
jgi:hypothetical protein